MKHLLKVILGDWEGVMRKMRYEWKGDDAKCTVAFCLIIAEVLITVIAVSMILTT